MGFQAHARRGAVLAALGAFALSAHAQEEVHFTGETTASALLVHDALQFLALYVRDHLDCPAIRAVEARVLPPGAVKRDPSGPEGTGPAVYERWNVHFCERQQPFTMVFWPSKSGGSMFRAEISDPCEWMSRFVSEEAPPLRSRRLRRVQDSMATWEIVEKLGPAARDVGSGIHVLEWDVTDGSVFYVETEDACATPRATGRRPAAESASASERTVPPR